MFSSQDIYIVTGAGRGIGKCIADSLASRGATVLALDVAFGAQEEDSNKRSRNDELQNSKQQRVISLICNVASEASVTAAFARLREIMADNDATPARTFKGLVNCAGIVLEKSLLETTVEDIDRVLGVNLRGPILCTKAAVQFLQQQEQQKQRPTCAATTTTTHTTTRTTTTIKFKIVNIASELAHLGREEYSVYCATKGGLISLTRAWAREFASCGILVNAVAPGPTDTPMLQSERNYTAWKETAEGIPLGRIGQPTDISSVVCFLLHPAEANFVTGAVWDVNGGAAMY